MDTCADFQMIFDTMAGIGCTGDSYMVDLSSGQPVLGSETYGETCALYGGILSCTVGTFEHAQRACRHTLSCANTRAKRGCFPLLLSLFLYSR